MKEWKILSRSSVDRPDNTERSNVASIDVFALAVNREEAEEAEEEEERRRSWR